MYFTEASGPSIYILSCIIFKLYNVDISKGLEYNAHLETAHVIECAYIDRSAVTLVRSLHLYSFFGYNRGSFECTSKVLVPRA